MKQQSFLGLLYRYKLEPYSSQVLLSSSTNATGLRQLQLLYTEKPADLGSMSVSHKPPKTIGSFVIIIQAVIALFQHRLLKDWYVRISEEISLRPRAESKRQK